MNYIPRALNISKHLNIKSCFLLGARGVGKSLLANKEIENFLLINLLEGKWRRELLNDPSLLKSIIKESNKKIVIIDEIQKIPELLDEVHNIIFESEGKIKFLLMGSSMRKIRRSKANMLGGRARKLELFPLTYYELNQVNKFDLIRFITFGGLPDIYFSDEPSEMLFDYLESYLKDEIAIECQIKELEGFEKFFTVAAYQSGELLNYSSVARDIQVSPQKVKAYFEILEDTLIGFPLLPFNTPKRKSINTVKFYFFDIGIVHNALNITSISFKSKDFGRAFEHFIILEIRSYLKYNRKKDLISFWRDKHLHEVDIIIGKHIAIEIKSSEKFNNRDLNNLLILKEAAPTLEQLFLISNYPLDIFEQGVHILNYKSFLDKLWGNEIC